MAEETPKGHRSLDALFNAMLTVATCWYFSGLTAAMGFSLGFYLIKPAHPSTAAQRDFLDAFTWMDGKWYKLIATDGYHYDPDARSNVAFFPVYPLLARGVTAVTALPAEAALLLVSNASFLVALALLFFYVRDRAPICGHRLDAAPVGDALADWTVLVAALFPTGCFFRLTYSESTFFLLAVLAMYAMLRRWPPLVIALIVGLATAARPVGVALLVPFAIHLARRYSKRPNVSAKCALYLPLGCWGLLALMAYHGWEFGDMFALFKTQEHWRIRAAVPWSQKAVAMVTLEPIWSVYDPSSLAFWGDFDAHQVPWFSLQFANPLFFAFAGGLIVTGAWPRGRSSDPRVAGGENPRRSYLSIEETSLSIAMLSIPCLTRAYEMGMGSMGRFAAVVFPAHIVVAQLLLRLPVAARTIILVLSGFFLATYSGMYAAGYCIF